MTHEMRGDFGRYFGNSQESVHVRQSGAGASTRMAEKEKNWKTYCTFCS